MCCCVGRLLAFVVVCKWMESKSTRKKGREKGCQEEAHYIKKFVGGMKRNGYTTKGRGSKNSTRFPIIITLFFFLLPLGYIRLTRSPGICPVNAPRWERERPRCLKEKRRSIVNCRSIDSYGCAGTFQVLLLVFFPFFLSILRHFLLIARDHTTPFFYT